MDRLKEELQSVREDKDLLAATQEISKREISEVTRLRQDLETSKKGLVELEEVKKERDDIKAEMKDLKSDLETAQVWPHTQVYCTQKNTLTCLGPLHLVLQKCWIHAL